MTLPLDLPGLDKAPASSVKTRGWPSLMRTVREKQALVITNHNHPEAVIVDIKTYQ
ncbi:type II toxin-antitoxin system prevent-host-death family antitoxin, partial [Stenotrophomonas lactitubi]